MSVPPPPEIVSRIKGFLYACHYYNTHNKVPHIVVFMKQNIQIRGSARTLQPLTDVTSSQIQDQSVTEMSVW